jgi:hypothetical protein
MTDNTIPSKVYGNVMTCKVYIWNPEKYDYANNGEGFMYVKITPEELARDYCIWNDMNLWLKSSVPADRESEVEVWNPTPYDISNYECFPYWDSDAQTVYIIRSANRKHMWDTSCESCLHDNVFIPAKYNIHFTEERVKGTNIKTAKYCYDCYKVAINQCDTVDFVKVI